MVPFFLLLYCQGISRSTSVSSENAAAAPWQEKLESEFCEAEGYHRLLDQQVVKLEMQVTGANTASDSAECKSVLDTSRALVDTIRQCLDMMQEVKTQLKSLEFGNAVSSPPVAPVARDLTDPNTRIGHSAATVETTNASASSAVATSVTIVEKEEPAPAVQAEGIFHILFCVCHFSSLPIHAHTHLDFDTLAATKASSVLLQNPVGEAVRSMPPDRCSSSAKVTTFGTPWTCQLMERIIVALFRRGQLYRTSPYDN